MSTTSVSSRGPLKDNLSRKSLSRTCTLSVGDLARVCARSLFYHTASLNRDSSSHLLAKLIKYPLTQSSPDQKFRMQDQRVMNAMSPRQSYTHSHLQGSGRETIGKWRHRWICGYFCLVKWTKKIPSISGGEFISVPVCAQQRRLLRESTKSPYKLKRAPRKKRGCPSKLTRLACAIYNTPNPTQQGKATARRIRIVLSWATTILATEPPKEILQPVMQLRLRQPSVWVKSYWFPCTLAPIQFGPDPLLLFLPSVFKPSGGHCRTGHCNGQHILTYTPKRGSTALTK